MTIRSPFGTPFMSPLSSFTGTDDELRRFIIDLLKASSTRNSQTTVLGYASDAVYTDDPVLLTVPANLVAIKYGRLVGTEWFDTDVNGVKFPNPTELQNYGAGTNLVLQSEDLQTTWNAGVGSTPTPLSYQEGNTLASVYRVSQGLSVASSIDPYTLQCVVDSTSDRFLQLGLSISSGDWGIATFDLDNLLVDELTAAAGTINRSSIEKINDTEYLCTMTYTPDTASASRETVVGLSPVASGFTPGSRGSADYDGDGVSMLYVSKMHVEAVDYITPYIKTTTTALTRNADVTTSPTPSFVEQDGDWAFKFRGTPHQTAQALKALFSFDSDATNYTEIQLNAANITANSVLLGVSNGAAVGLYSHTVDVPFETNVYYVAATKTLGIRSDDVSGDISAVLFGEDVLVSHPAITALLSTANSNGANQAICNLDNDGVPVFYASKEDAGW